MTNIRDLLSQNPMTFNELLDLFEAYVSSIGAPLFEATNLIRDELNYYEGDIFGHIVGVSNDAEDMAKRLGQIRAARNSGTDVTININHYNAKGVEISIREVSRMIANTATVLAQVQHHLEANSDDGNDTAIALVELLLGAARSADEREVTTLLSLAKTISEAGKYRSTDLQVSNDPEVSAPVPTSDVGRVAARLTAGDQAPQSKAKAK